MLDKTASHEQIARSIWSNMADFCACFGRIDGGECRLEPDLQWIRSGRGILDSIVGARFPLDSADARVDEVTDMVKSWGTPVTWRICPESTPVDLPERLLARGWKNPRGGDQPTSFAGMAMPLDAPVSDACRPDALQIVKASSPEDLRAWPHVFFSAMSAAGDTDKYGEIFCELGLADPGNRIHYTGFLNGEPVTSCMLYVSSGVAGLYAIGTRADCRGRGIGTAITRYALQQAKELGCHWAILQATDMGIGVYSRLGFRQYGSVRILVLSP